MGGQLGGKCSEVGLVACYGAGLKPVLGGLRGVVLLSFAFLRICW